MRGWLSVNPAQVIAEELAVFSAWLHCALEAVDDLGRNEVVPIGNIACNWIFDLSSNYISPNICARIGLFWAPARFEEKPFDPNSPVSSPGLSAIPVG
jgi:hypothetical protein